MHFVGMQVERAVIGSILGVESRSAKSWQERRDVPTSRHPNVVTSQRRNVGSTKIEVNKWQRRDVSAISASPSLKAKRGPEFEASGYVRTRALKAESSEGNQ